MINQPNKKNSRSSRSTIIVIIGISVFGLYVLYQVIPKRILLWPLAKIVNTLLYGLLFVLNFPVRLWMILLILAIRISYLQLRTRRRERKERELNKDIEFLSYKKDVLINWLWTWDYMLNPLTNDYRLADLRPLCKQDETPLVKNGDHGYICPHCKTSYGDKLNGEFPEPEDRELIVPLIERNIRKIMNN